MERTHDLSVVDIKKQLSSLPDTFYGERCNVSFHTEDIFRVSGLYDEPILFSDMGVSLCVEGKFETETNLLTNKIAKGTMEFFSPGSIFQVKSMSNNCKIIGIAFNPFMVKEIFNGNVPGKLLEHRKYLKIKLNPKDSKLFCEMSRVYLNILKSYGESSKCAMKMAGCILEFAINRFESNAGSNESKCSRGAILCRKFLALLGEVKGHHREISWFADQLCVSNHYLSVAVKRFEGRTVKELIDSSVNTEIKIRLMYGNKSVAQIAEELEFGNSSFLCKYFKSLNGCTPLQYRKYRQG